MSRKSASWFGDEAAEKVINVASRKQMQNISKKPQKARFLAHSMV